MVKKARKELESRQVNVWSKDQRVTPVLIGEDEEFYKLFNEREKLREEKDPDSGFLDSLFASCVELIFIKIDKKSYGFAMIIRAIDAKTLEIIVTKALELSGFDSEDELKKILARAMVEEIEVFGDNAILQSKLEKLQAEVIEDGFFVEIDGKKKKFKIAKYKELLTSNSIMLLDRLRLGGKVSKVDINLLAKKVHPELKAASEITNKIEKLRKAINELYILLSSTKRNENSIQSFLTRNPIFFGLEYTDIKPKHCLGSEYEMDYALKKINGTYDLVEIEASNLKLYNKKGDPTAYLVHAEQQVHDWLLWINESHGYADRNLPGIVEPKGFVVIGRTESLTMEQKKKLLQRNRINSGKIEILTYDDLLLRAQTILNYLLEIK